MILVECPDSVGLLPLPSEVIRAAQKLIVLNLLLLLSLP